jgi:hypothetical protein
MSKPHDKSPEDEPLIQMPPSRKPNYAAYPNVYSDGANLVVVDPEHENFKRSLVGLPPLPIDPDAPLRFKRVREAAAELGWHVKKIKRIAYQQRAAAKAAAEAKADTAAVVAKRAPAKRRLEPVGGE